MIWKKYKIAIIILAFLGMLTLLYFFVIDRLVTEIGVKRNKLQGLMVTQESQLKRAAELPRLRNDFEMLVAAEEKIHPFLKKDKAVELIQEVEKLAELTGNKVSIEIGTPDVPGKASAKNATETIVSGLPMKDYIQLKIKITGSFFGLIKLLNKLENSSYYLDVISLQMSRNQEQAKDESAEADTKNPFAQSSLSGGSKSKVLAENDQEIVSLINVVVYTQN